MDRSKLPPGFRSYLDNAEKKSGKTLDKMHLVLSKSGLKKHGELRSHLMEKLGLGHGHANAVVAVYLTPQDEPVKGAVKAATAKPTAKTKPAARK